MIIPHGPNIGKVAKSLYRRIAESPNGLPFGACGVRKGSNKLPALISAGFVRYNQKSQRYETQTIHQTVRSPESPAELQGLPEAEKSTGAEPLRREIQIHS